MARRRSGHVASLGHMQPCYAIWHHAYLSTLCSGNGFLSDGTKSLPEPTKALWTTVLPSTGYDYNLPGYPTYDMLVSEELGQYNLRIRDITLRDDARYECQVTPSGDSQLLQAAARVIVLGELGSV